MITAQKECSEATTASIILMPNVPHNIHASALTPGKSLHKPTAIRHAAQISLPSPTPRQLRSRSRFASHETCVPFRTATKARLLCWRGIDGRWMWCTKLALRCYWDTKQLMDWLRVQYHCRIMATLGSESEAASVGFCGVGRRRRQIAW